jgi:hypothetical protein
MSFETELLHDGTQVAAANYYNPSSPLAGPSGSGQFLAVVQSQSADLTVVLASVAGSQINGVLQNKPIAGEVADVGFGGVSKAVVGSAGSTHGKPQMVDATGAFTDWTAGSGYAQVGMARESGTAGAIISMFVYGPSSPKILT